MTQNNGLLKVNDRAMGLRGTSLGIMFHLAVFVSRRLLSPKHIATISENNGLHCPASWLRVKRSASSMQCTMEFLGQV
ncbi:hypothetical protein BDZ89DRAFT_1061587 [Hymenopellis radicata]|nr:hypothetical protein BDZ89DRAFT_1061587 [Hymenopellis radicata]